MSASHVKPDQSLRVALRQVQDDVKKIKGQLELDTEIGAWEDASDQDLQRWESTHLYDEEGRDVAG